MNEWAGGVHHEGWLIWVGDGHLRFLPDAIPDSAMAQFSGPYVDGRVGANDDTVEGSKGHD